MRTTHAIRLLMSVAERGGARASVSEIARSFDASENHFAKIANVLGRCGWLETVRGRGGGVRLGAPAEEIVLGAVVRAVEPLDAVLERGRQEDLDCPLLARCRFRRIADGAVEAFLHELDRYTLADVLCDRRSGGGCAADAPA